MKTLKQILNRDFSESIQANIIADLKEWFQQKQNEADEEKDVFAKWTIEWLLEDLE